MTSVVNVGRLQLVNRSIFVWVPLLIMAAALAVVILIGLIADSDEPLYTGAAQAPLWYFLVAGVQALTLTFPFSQALSITRRAYFVGTMAAFAVVSLVFALLFALLALLEEASGGWWLQAHVYSLPWLSGPWFELVLLVWTAAFLLFTAGMWSATIYKRWGTVGTVVGAIAAALLLVGLAAVVTFSGSWASLGRWFQAQTPTTAAGWLALLTVLLATGSYLTLRRAVP